MGQILSKKNITYDGNQVIYESNEAIAEVKLQYDNQNIKYIIVENIATKNGNNPNSGICALLTLIDDLMKRKEVYPGTLVVIGTDFVNRKSGNLSIWLTHFQTKILRGNDVFDIEFREDRTPEMGEFLSISVLNLVVRLQELCQGKNFSPSERKKAIMELTKCLLKEEEKRNITKAKREKQTVAKASLLTYAKQQQKSKPVYDLKAPYKCFLRCDGVPAFDPSKNPDQNPNFPNAPPLPPRVEAIKETLELKQNDAAERLKARLESQQREDTFKKNKEEIQRKFAGKSFPPPPPPPPPFSKNDKIFDKQREERQAELENLRNRKKENDIQDYAETAGIKLLFGKRRKQKGKKRSKFGNDLKYLMSL
jgi:hypothetical protein